MLFNEPLTGASPGVCAQLMRELLAVVKLREARGLWVTHQLDVVAQYGLANACLPGSRLGSIFVSLREGRPDYAIRTGVPERNRYASELFARQ